MLDALLGLGTKASHKPLPRGAYVWQIADKYYEQLIASWNKQNEREKHGPKWWWWVVEMGMGSQRGGSDAVGAQRSAI